MHITATCLADFNFLMLSKFQNFSPQLGKESEIQNVVKNHSGSVAPRGSQRFEFQNFLAGDRFSPFGFWIITIFDGKGRGLLEDEPCGDVKQFLTCTAPLLEPFSFFRLGYLRFHSIQCASMRG